MKTNKNAVQAKINVLSKELNIKVNVLLATFFFDAFLLRLSKSLYQRFRFQIDRPRFRRKKSD